MVANTGLSIVLAVLASLCFATAVVFQQEAAVEAQSARATQRHSVFGLALGLLRRRVWLFATLVDFSGFMLQATALHFGRITDVQPILVTVLAFGMVLGAWRSETSLGWVDLTGALLLSLGIVGFLLAADPEHGSDSPTPGRLPLVVVSVLGLLAVGVAISAANGGKGGGFAEVSQRVPVTGGKKYVLRFHVRTLGFPGGENKDPGPNRGYVSLQSWVGWEGAPGGVWVANHQDTTLEWKTLTEARFNYFNPPIPYTAPPGATGAVLKFSLSANSAGHLPKAYVDDVEFVEVP